MNLTDVANLFEATDCLSHEREFFWFVAYILDCDGRCLAGVDDTLVFFNGHPHPVVVKYRPILSNEGGNPGLNGFVKIGEVQLLAESFAMKSFIEGEVECGVNLIERRRWMPQSSKYRTTIDIIKEIIMHVGLIRETLVISKDLLDPAATTFPFCCDANDITGRGCCRLGWSFHR